MRAASCARARILAWRTRQAIRSRVRVETAGRLLARVWGTALSVLLPLATCERASRAHHRIRALLASILDSQPESPASGGAVMRTCSRQVSPRADVVLLAADDVEPSLQYDAWIVKRLESHARTTELHFPLSLYKQTVAERIPRGVDFVHLVTADRRLAGRLVGLEAEVMHAEPDGHLLVVWSRTIA